MFILNLLYYGDLAVEDERTGHLALTEAEWGAHKRLVEKGDE